MRPREAHPVVAEGISMAIQSAALLCEQLLAHPEFKRGRTRFAEMRTQVRAEYALAWRRNFSRRLFVAASLAHVFMRPISTRIAATLLRGLPQLLTAGARWSGKSVPLRAARRGDVTRS